MPPARNPRARWLSPNVFGGFIGEKALDVSKSDKHNSGFTGETTLDISKVSRVFSPIKLPPI